MSFQGLTDDSVAIDRNGCQRKTADNDRSALQWRHRLAGKAAKKPDAREDLNGRDRKSGQSDQKIGASEAQDQMAVHTKRDTTDADTVQSDHIPNFFC